MPHRPDQHPTELLPWLANGTLQGAERDAVQRHVDECAECQTELNLLLNLRTTLQSEGLPEGGGELGLQRLLRQVGRAPKPASRWWLPAALAASLVIGVQTVMLLQRAPDESLYAPMSGPATGEGQLQVEFMPDAREEDLRELLRTSGVRIVDGPSAVGIYRLAVEPGIEPGKVVRSLRAHSDLIRHAALEQ
jgi:anti-sigma factor RsiW